MLLTPSPNVVEHVVALGNGSLPEWPSSLSNIANALPKVTGLSEKSQVISEEYRDNARFVVFRLRAALRRERRLGIPPNPKTRFLVLLVRHIFLLIVPHLEIWETTRFAVPMHPLAHVNPLARCFPTASTASLLLLSPMSKIPSLDIPSSPSSDFASDLPPEEYDGDSMSAPLKLPARRRTVSGHSQTEQPQVTASHPWRDGSALQAHMLSQPDGLSATLLCLFCMADSENIFDAVASALHQRHVWGVMQPIVGLAFDPFETTVQVVFGWFESVEAGQGSVVRHCFVFSGFWSLLIGGHLSFLALAT
ncbi:hypothetical protein OF83DRAFT_1128221, partial [Amylostereum chailletii]